MGRNRWMGYLVERVGCMSVLYILSNWSHSVSDPQRFSKYFSVTTSLPDCFSSLLLYDLSLFYAHNCHIFKVHWLQIQAFVLNDQEQYCSEHSYTEFSVEIISVLLGVYLGRELLGCVVSLCLPFWETVKSFSILTALF